ncbi:MAG TPA: helix-turn-helix domain-containing protein [Ktedonobacteraceae bacterium]|nr:helix-turn-helix domain-containing protein [Ktedonobacteraceae bacterium]
MKDQDNGSGWMGNRLDYWMKWRGYKKYEVAEATNIPMRTLNDYCRGRTAIPRYRLEALARFLECPIAALLGEGETAQHEARARGANVVPPPQKTSPLEKGKRAQSIPSVIGESVSTPQSIIESVADISFVVPTSSSLSEFNMFMKSRRQVLQEILQVACAAITLSPYELLPKESQARLEWATTHTSYLDNAALDDLSAITASYWSLSKNASVEMLSGISGHFATLVQFLKDAHPDRSYQRLCSLASESALILGKTFHEIKEYDLAWTYYKFALKVALDSGNRDLWAAGIGRVALLLIYWGEPHHALPLLHEAQRTPPDDQRISLWLAAIEAEIHAIMGNKDTCLRLLDQTKAITLPASLADDRYWTGFDPSRAAGYEGACLMRLHQPTLALPALERAFALCEPTFPRSQSMLIADMGTIYAQLGEPKEACRFLQQALDMTMQTKSLVVVQRVCKARSELRPWKDNEDVKCLDDQITETLTALTKLKERVLV